MSTPGTLRGGRIWTCDLRVVSTMGGPRSMHVHHEIHYSMGAFIGAALLGSHPGRFTSMILGGIGDETEVSVAAATVIAAALRADDPESISDPLGRAFSPSSTRIPPAIGKPSVSCALDAGMTATLSSSEVPGCETLTYRC